MSEDKKKQIPIEEGADEAEEVKAEEAEEKAEGETAEEAEKEEASMEDEANKAEEEAKKAEEAESERYMRLMAEFQNFKRRVAREKSDIHAYANEKIVGDLLPVIDNFERAMQTKPENDKFADGIELIYKQFLTVLDKNHVTEIPAKGEKFDPVVHMAVQMMPVEGMESDMVAEVIKKGYKLNDKVIRPAMVVVSQ